MKRINIKTKTFSELRSNLVKSISIISMVSIILFFSPQAFSQDYVMEFYSLSDTINIQSVEVTNLSLGTTFALSAADAIHILSPADVRCLPESGSDFEIFPNPTNENFFVKFFAPESGQVSFSVADISGKIIYRNSFYAVRGFHKIEADGALQGVYFINIHAESYNYTGKIIGTSGQSKELNAFISQSVPMEVSQSINTKTKSLFEMPYNFGDVLLITATSETGNKTVKTFVIVDANTYADGDNISVFFNFYSCKDFEQYEYAVVEFNDKIWMAENLNTEYFANDIHIKLIDGANTWSQLSSVAYCNYNNSPSLSDTYGKLYNWHSVNYLGGLCPLGWHVATDEEWLELEMFLGLSATAANTNGWHGDFEGCYLKESGTTHWSADPEEMTNFAGFTALPAGIRTLTGEFSHQNSYAAWWTATASNVENAWSRALRADSCDIYREDGKKVLGLSVRCVYNENIDSVIPVYNTALVSTMTISEILMNDALCTTSITEDGGAEVTSRGIVWNTIPNPDVVTNEKMTIDGSGIGTFVSVMDDLSNNTTYYVRAYATNSVGTSYGLEMSFTTLEAYFTPGSEVLDIDGNTYSTVIVEATEYITSNLRTSRYNDGTPLLRADNSSTWNTNSSPMYCWYNDDSVANEVKYGKLYNHHAINNGNLCPTGWHVASDSEWKHFEFYLGMNETDTSQTGWRGTDQGAKLKECGNINWLAPNVDATNQSGFSATGAGSRNNDGGFEGQGESYCIWTSTMDISSYSWMRKLTNAEPRIYRGIEADENGFSVRCVKTPITAPVVVTSFATDISVSTAIVYGNITHDSWVDISAKGIVWNKTGNPDLSNNDGFTDLGEGTGEIMSVIYNLESATDYYVRTYATNVVGTSYGEEISFSTLANLFTPGPGVNDPDGNFYETIILNDREWMAGNLRSHSFVMAKTGSAKDTVINENLYGRLYQAFELQQGGRCPEGWFVASEDDWKELELFLGVDQTEIDYMGWRGTTEGGKLKEPGFLTWNSPNLGATNESGFNFKAAGYFNENGNYVGEGEVCRYWTSDTEQQEPYFPYARELSFNESRINRIAVDPGSMYYVRCVKPAGIPSLITKEITVDENYNYFSGGIFVLPGSSAVFSKGVVWSAESNPTLMNNTGLTDEGSGADEYICQMYEIQPGETYYLRAYASNNEGTAYGNTISFVGTASIQQMLDFGIRPMAIVNMGFPVDSLYGKAYDEGIIVSLDLEDGGGLLCAPDDYTSAEWGCSGLETGAVGTIIGTGKYNTRQITDVCIMSMIAADLARYYNNGWYTDWYLPSQDEMMLVFSRSEYISGLSASPYWTSTESSTNSQNMAVIITNGIATESAKSNIFTFRPMRHFYSEPVFDYENNYYPVLRIGNQSWMGGNLRAMSFQNGDLITFAGNASEWVSNTGNTSFSYSQDDLYASYDYGFLYNFNAVSDLRNVCPVGWHVPSDSDWDILVNFLGGELVAGGKLKNVDASIWAVPNTDATNVSSFNAYPSGYRTEFDGSFASFSESALFWSSTPDDSMNSWARSLNYNDGNVTHNTKNVGAGLSIRCVKD